MYLQQSYFFKSAHMTSKPFRSLPRPHIFITKPTSKTTEQRETTQPTQKHNTRETIEHRNASHEIPREPPLSHFQVPILPSKTRKNFMCDTHPSGTKQNKRRACVQCRKAQAGGQAGQNQPNSKKTGHNKRQTNSTTTSRAD